MIAEKGYRSITSANNNTNVKNISIMKLEYKMTIKEARLLLGIKQVEFAKLVGVTRTQLSHWENGKFRPQPCNQEKIKDLVNVADPSIQIDFDKWI